MHSIYVRDVVRVCHGKLLCGSLDLELIEFCTDSRKVGVGDVYVGICGERVDGNDFYEEAIKRGASCLILSKEPQNKCLENVSILLVPDTIKCLQELASYKRSLYNIPVIAITGSVGKTSTKDIVYSVVSKKYKTLKTMGNYNNHLGVPLTVLGLRDHEAMVVEMGMNHLGEISLLSHIVKPTIAIVTNVGTAHIGNLGSRENIRRAKLEILDGMVGRQVILNHDDDMLVEVEDELRKKYDVNTVSILDKSTYQAVNLKEDVFSSTFDVLGYADQIMVNVGGRAYIYNSLIAYAVGKILDISDEEIKRGIFEFKLTSSRLEKKVTKKGTILIDDTYNANYDSMKASIELLGRVQERRRIAILGDMLELGEYTKDLHSKLGDVVVEQGIDQLITIGEYSRWIAKRAIDLGMKEDNIISFDKERESYLFLDKFLDQNDIVLLKGSHGIHLVGIVDYLMGK